MWLNRPGPNGFHEILRKILLSFHLQTFKLPFNILDFFSDQGKNLKYWVSSYFLLYVAPAGHSLTLT